MKLNKLTAPWIAGAILIGGLGATGLLPSAATANHSPSHQETQVITGNILRSGTFVTTEQDHPTTGKASLVTENGQRYLEFDAAFGTATGPDVQIILHRRRQVPVNVSEQDYVTLAPLKSLSGAQRYAIPANLDLDEFQSVAIWCRKFNVTFGYASL